MSEYDGHDGGGEYFDGGHDGGEYFDGGEYYDGEHSPAFDSLPEDSWVRDPEWVNFAHLIVEAVRNDPAAVENWYDEFAKGAGLRELAARELDAREVTAKFGTSDFRKQVAAALKKAHGK